MTGTSMAWRWFDRKILRKCLLVANSSHSPFEVAPSVHELHLDECGLEKLMIIEKKVTSHSRLGFIGLGYLGSRIARRLVAAGFPMVVYDRDREKTTELAALGATVAPNPEALAEEVM